MRATYLFLRGMMICLSLLLLLVSAHHAWSTGSWEGSISAYYGGPVRDVFVGVLIAIAACLVAYRGRFALEDFALNAAGFFAVYVALVPAHLNIAMQDLRETEGLVQLLQGISDLDDEQRSALNELLPAFTAEEYGTSLRAALTIYGVLCVALLGLGWKNSTRVRELFGSSGWRRNVAVGLLVATLAFVVMTYLQLFFLGPANQISLPGLAVFFDSSPFEVHAIAAILMIASLAVAVASHAMPEDKKSILAEDKYYLIGYQVIVGLMIVGAVVIGLVEMDWLYPADRKILVLEWFEIILFVIFWAVETFRVNRRQKRDFKVIR